MFRKILPKLYLWTRKSTIKIWRWKQTNS